MHDDDSVIDPAEGRPWHTCETCGEKFGAPVWHCTNCDHHHGMDRTECNNCHKPREGADT